MARKEITFYAFTGYSYNDEPASDAVIDQNEHWIMPGSGVLFDLYDIAQEPLKTHLTDDEMRKVDYVKLRDIESGERAYYFVTGKNKRNSDNVELTLVIDAFATVGLNNISFLGNISRRSLSSSEAQDYPLLPEPWAPKRPLKVRRFILDGNKNKKLRIPTFISTTFEKDVTDIEDTETINVPNSPIGLSTFQDSLSISAKLLMMYPNVATTTNHTISSPWGSVQYDTPYEAYLELAGAAMTSFLRDAKMSNALDLVSQAYYLPTSSTENISVPECAQQGKYPKSNKFYTVITIRSLANGGSNSYSDNDTDLDTTFPVAIVVVPDKMGGMYAIPTKLRDTGLNAYTYASGVYSPFETAVLNAVGDTPAKFASDGTVAINIAQNELFQEYIGKVNAIQRENMQAGYFKDLGLLKGNVMGFVSLALALTSEAVSVVAPYVQQATIDTSVPTTTTSNTGYQDVPYQSQRTQGTTTASAYKQTGSQTFPSVNTTTTGYQDVAGRAVSATYENGYRISVNQSNRQDGHTVSSTTNVDSVKQTVDNTMTQNAHRVNTGGSNTNYGYTQRATQNTTMPEQRTVTTTRQEGAERSVTEGVKIAVDGVPQVYDQMPDWGTLRTIVLGSYVNEVHSLMLGNINDYISRWAAIQNDMHNGKVSNLFKNVTLVGSFSNTNMVAGKYEVLISYLDPVDASNFDMFLDHFGHAVDEYSTSLVTDVRPGFNYTLVGEDAMLSNSVRPELSAQILLQFRNGVRTWKTLVRAQNF